MNARDALDTIAARADAATEGPWDATWGPRERARVWADDADVEPLAILTGFTDPADGRADAEFIAAARQDVPALVAFARSMLAFRDELDAVYQGHGANVISLSRVVNRIDTAIESALDPS